MASFMMTPVRLQSAHQSGDAIVPEVDPSRQPADKTVHSVTDVETKTETDPPFSIYSPSEKKWISSVASFGAMFSTVSSYIYFPALVPIAAELRVSLTMINLTVTSYLVVAGIAPAFMGDIADQGGRRPAYILMFTLAPQASRLISTIFVMSLTNRFEIKGSYGAAYGIIADITTTTERGSTNAAPSFGPVVAGALTQKFGWRWIFWFLVIMTGTYLIPVILLLPETQKKLVGNGSVQARGIHRSAFDLFTSNRKIKGDQGERHGKRKPHIPNPLKSILMLRSKENLTVIMIGSITYLVKMTLQTSLAAQCTDIYNLDYLQAGKFLDRNIELFASRHGRGGQYRRGDDISDFPIEEARLVGIYTLVITSALGTAGFGISLMKQTHIAVPLTMQFISGATTSSIFTSLQWVSDWNADLRNSSNGYKSQCLRYRPGFL
ncbi:hypothetical protein N7466_009083 [Penicillium verhagenii]|uniref:uncharacterized protein n=1 Tax=Penicillium verhagenii TaxID=1562060 RepID=UPI002545B2A3|nr:uncharacterized protein N7466_009083 [Penicillium verhagenii]KAJ5920757.1 hypothetical protein N7466_009083 [Penicillium verhagenii]